MIVTIEVDDPPTSFRIDEAFIRGSSKFFDKALNAEWKEGQSHIIQLPESDATAFSVYLNWRYFGRLFVEDGENGKMSKSWWNLVEAYILGDKLLDSDFKDAICDAVAEKSQVDNAGEVLIFGPKHRRHLYENTVSGSPMRRLLCRRLCTLSDCDKIVEEDEPSAFLYDMTQELLRAYKRKRKIGEEGLTEFRRELEGCVYHEHAPGVENCYRTRYQWNV